MKKVIIFALTLAGLLSGCTSTKSIQAMRTEQDPVKTEKNLSRLNKLMTKSYTDPHLLAEAMETGCILSHERQLGKMAPEQYELLMDNYRRIRSVPPIKERKLGNNKMPVADANAYLFAWSIYCTSRAGGHRAPQDVIAVFSEINPTGYQQEDAALATLYGVDAHLSAVQTHDELMFQVLSGLIHINTIEHDDERYEILFRNAEEGVVSLALLNRALRQREEVATSEASLAYLLNLNARALERMTARGQLEAQEQVLENLALLSALAIPDTLQNRDHVAENIRRQARHIMLTYQPCAYYHALLNVWDQDLGYLTELVELATLMNAHNAASEAAGNKAFYTFNDAVYLNHRTLFSPDYYTGDCSAAKAAFLKALSQTVASQDTAYRKFYYSHLYTLYPEALANYLINQLGADKDRETGLLLQQALLAANLSEEERIPPELQEKLDLVLLQLSVKNAPLFTADEFRRFYTDVAPYLYKHEPAAFVKGQMFVLKQAKNIPDINCFTISLLEGLNRLETLNEAEGWDHALSALLGLHDPAVSRLVAGFMAEKDLPSLIRFFVEVPFSDQHESQLTVDDVNLFGRIVCTHKDQLEEDLFFMAFSPLKSLIRHTNDEISVRAACYANELEVYKTSKAQITFGEVSRRWNGVRL